MDVVVRSVTVDVYVSQSSAYVWNVEGRGCDVVAIVGVEVKRKEIDPECLLEEPWVCIGMR